MYFIYSLPSNKQPPPKQTRGVYDRSIMCICHVIKHLCGTLVRLS